MEIYILIKLFAEDLKVMNGMPDGRSSQSNKTIPLSVNKIKNTIKTYKVDHPDRPYELSNITKTDLEVLNKSVNNLKDF